MQSLVARTIATLLAVGLFTGVIGVVAIRDSARGALEEEVRRQNPAAAQRLATELDGRIEGLKDALLLLATRADLVNLSPDRTELQVALRAMRDLDTLVLWDGEGRAVAAVANRRVVGPADFSAKPDAVAALEPGSARSRIVTAGEVPLLELTAPVEGPPGTVVGALVGSVPFEIVAGGVQASFVGPTAVGFVVGPDGTILAHPERDRVAAGERFPVADVLEAEDRVRAVEGDDGRRLASAAEATTVDATVVVEQAEDEIYAPIDDELLKLTLLVVVSLGATVVLLGAAGTRVVRPLANLARTVRRIGAGDRSARVEVAGVGEVRVVAEEINRMAGALERRLTELEEAQEELATTEAHFRAAFDQAPVAMAITSADGRYQEVNPALCALLGRTQGELLAGGWADVTHPDDVAESQRFVDAALGSNPPGSYHFEKRYVHADGRTIWGLLSVAVVVARDRSRSLIAHVQDVTEQRRADEEREALLRKALTAEDRVTRLMEAAPDATLVVAGDGRIAYANRRVAEMFGHEPSALVGANVEVLLPERFRERHEGHRAVYMDVPRARSMGAGLSLWGRRADGSEFPVEVSLAPLEVDGETQVVASVRDVTERRSAEATVRTLDAMRSRQRQAVELNDNIVQGLTVAKWAFERQRLDDARKAVERTLAQARTLIQDMLREASAVELAPGDLVRQRPAGFDS